MLPNRITFLITDKKLLQMK